MSASTCAVARSTIDSLALMFPVMLPLISTEPQLIVAETLAPSPMTSRSVVVISPVNVPSIRT